MSGIHTDLLPVRQIGVCFLWIYTGLLPVRRIGVCLALDSNRPVTGKTNWNLFCCGFIQACFQ
jgi:hypothetical protein